MLFGSVSHAETVKNVLIGPEPTEFIKCVAQASLIGSQLQFLGLGTVNLLGTDPSQIEIKFLAKDNSGKSGFFKIVATSMDQQNG
jgi:hypothetical protein